jgi:hypothetical protein
VDLRRRRDLNETATTGLSDLSLAQEASVSAKPPRRVSLSVIATAALAAFIAIGLLASVTVLLQLDGAPLELLVRAERACTQLHFVSERDACMRKLLIAVQASSIAGK